MRSAYFLRDWLVSKPIFRRITKKYFNTENTSIKIKNLLNKANVFDIAGARLVGLHNHIIMFSLGHFGVSPFSAFLVNTIFAFIDAIFYWIIVGGGQILLDSLLPQVNVTQLVTSEKFSNYLITLTLLAYILYFLYRILIQKSKV